MTMPSQRPYRFLRHLATDHGSVKRKFSAAFLDHIKATTAAGEKRHRAQLRFAVEPALPLLRVIHGVAPRERALEVFSLLRVWDTEENCGVLIYLLLADRGVEIVADRGIQARVGSEVWESVCRKMETAFRGGRFAEGVQAGMAEINALLERHYPRNDAAGENELPDEPVVL